MQLGSADTDNLLGQNDHNDRPEPSPNPDVQPDPFGISVDGPIRRHDAAWTVVFAVSTSMVLSLALINIGRGTVCSDHLSLNLCNLSFRAVIALMTCAAFSSIFGFVWMNLIARSKFSSNIVSFSISLNVVVWSGLGLIASSTGAWYTALIAIFWCLAFGLFYIFMRHRLHFTSALLATSFSCLKCVDPLLRTVLGVQFALSLYQIAWLLAVSNLRSPLLFFFMFIHQIWALNVALNFVYVVTGDVVAAWASGASSNSISERCRAKTCPISFGSVCFGSLILAFAQTLKILAQGSSQGGVPGSFLASFIFGVLEYISNFVSRCIFGYVAIWKLDLYSAMDRTGTLLRTRAVDVFVNYNFVGFVLGASAVIGGIFGACIGVVVYTLLGGGHGQAQLLINLSWIIGFFMTLLTLTVVESMANCLMILWAEVPDVLSANRPAEYQSLVTAVREIYPAAAAPQSEV